MKKIIGILIVTLLIATAISVAETSRNDDQIDQSQEQYDNWLYLVAEEYWMAQSFKPTMPTLTRVELLLYEWNNVFYELTVSIREKLDGSDLTQITLAPEGHLTYAKWIEFDFPDIVITPGVTYYIVCSAYEGSPVGRMKCYGWGFCLENDSYPNGNVFNNNVDNNFSWGETSGDLCFRTYGIPNEPPLKPEIQGELNGLAGEEYSYTLVATDPENNDLYYYVEWGDGNITEWFGPHTSGEQVTASHTYLEEGTYIIKAKAKDIHGFESEWNTLEINMPKKKPYINTLFLQFLENHPHLFPLIRQLLKL